MSHKFSVPPDRLPNEKLERDIRDATLKYHPGEDKIRIVSEKICGEEGIASLWQHGPIAENLYHA